MKRSSRKPQPQTKPVMLDQVELYTERLVDHHQQEFHDELLEPAPEWIYLLGVHLRLVELEHLAPAVQELL
jgi:hypothetical protein